MNHDQHTRARELMRKHWIEELSAAERAWLDTHLAECRDCSLHGERTRSAITELRSVPVTADPALVELTRGKVLRRAQELREAQERTRMLVVACVASFISGGITLPLLWRLFAWAGARADVANPVWQVAFVGFVVLPGLLGAVALLARRSAPDFVRLHGAGE